MKTVNCRAIEAALGGVKLVCGEHIALKPPGQGQGVTNSLVFEYYSNSWTKY